MKSLFGSILEIFLKPEYLNKTNDLGKVELHPHNYCSLDHLYMGIEVQLLIDKFTATGELPSNDLHSFRVSAMNFYITVVNQIKKRIDHNDETMINLSILDPKNIGDKIHQSIYPLLKQFPNLIDAGTVQATDDEFRVVRNLVGDWPTGEFEGSITFWTKVLSTKHWDGEAAFPNLRKIVPGLLSLPHLSATVERIFSIYNLNKTIEKLSELQLDARYSLFKRICEIT